MARHNEIGKWGEELAASYLAGQGYVIMQRDFRIGHRDLDIVATDTETGELVFVEVKTRATNSVAEPETAVDYNKMRSLKLAANAYIKSFHVYQDCRFDVVSIVGTPDTQFQIKLIKDAFNPLLL